MVYYLCHVHIVLVITGFPDSLIYHWLSFMDEVGYLGYCTEEDRQDKHCYLVSWVIITLSLINMHVGNAEYPVRDL